MVTTSPQDEDPENMNPVVWTRRDRQFLWVCGVLLVGILVLGAIRRGGLGREEIEIQKQPELDYSYQLDINRATWVEFAQLEGIGEVLARRIESDRVENGPFESVEDLNRVQGIGEGLLSRIRPHLILRR